MGAANDLFRISMLMNYTEIDAFSAQKTAGSKNAYFGKLNAFVCAAPEVLSKLKPPETPAQLEAFTAAIDVLQGYLLDVGSTALVWESEKAAEFARDGAMHDCAQALAALIEKVNQLRVKINNARFDYVSLSKPPEGQTQPEHAAAPTQQVVLAPQLAPVAPAKPLVQAAPAQGTKPPGSLRVEPFEKLSMLVENFEIDSAQSMLQSMLSYTYKPEIDLALVFADKYLGLFDYDAATAELSRALAIVRALDAGGAKNQKPKVLAIDDVPDVLNTVKSILQKEYNVYSVTNHKAALKFLSSNVADLILLDIEMPDMNGIALLSLIRKIKAYEKTPVLFLTGNVTVENVMKSRLAGGNDFIKKPVDAEVLLAKVAKHLSET